MGWGEMRTPDDLAALREALEFYADPANWQAVELERSGENVLVERGPAHDGGRRAREVLGCPEPVVDSVAEGLGFWITAITDLGPARPDLRAVPSE
jgi:hypothetical protein